MEFLAQGEKIVIGMVGLPARGKVSPMFFFKLTAVFSDPYFQKNCSLLKMVWPQMRSVQHRWEWFL